MKNVLTILFILFCFDSFCQTATFKTGNESVVTKYEVQQSKDTLSWSTIATITKGQNTYTYSPLVTNYYYRIKAAGTINFYTRPILYTVENTTVSITKATWTAGWWNDYLYCTIANEVNVSYYIIEKSIGTGSYSQILKVTPKGAGNYKFTVSRKGTKKNYRIKAFYKTGSSGLYINFI